MVSFKVKLVSYFILLTLVPLGAALWGLDALSKRSETRRADARLQAGLRTGLNGYADAAAALDRTGRRLAGFTTFQNALRTRDRAVLADVVAANPDMQVRAGRLVLGPTPPAEAVVRSVDVVSAGRLVGTITNWFTIDGAFLDQVARRTAVEPGETFVLLRNGRIAVGPAADRGAVVPLEPGIPAVRRVAGTRYR